MKPGYKSTEFWLSLLAVLVGAALASGAVGEESALFKVLTFAASALAALGYTAARAFVKNAEAKKDALVAAAGASVEKP